MRFRKALVPLEPGQEEPETMSVLSQAIETESSFPETPPQLTVTSPADWAPSKMTKQERAILRLAIYIVSKQREPVPYQDLLNQAYMELVERKEEFHYAR